MHLHLCSGWDEYQDRCSVSPVCWFVNINWGGHCSNAISNLLKAQVKWQGSACLLITAPYVIVNPDHSWWTPNKVFTTSSTEVYNIESCIMGNDSHRQVIKAPPYRLIHGYIDNVKIFSSFAPDSVHAVQKNQGRERQEDKCQQCSVSMRPSTITKIENSRIEAITSRKSPPYGHNACKFQR